MKRVIIILLTFFAVSSSMADTSALPTYEQAKKLVAAAWKSPPRSIDVTYYLTVKDNTRTEEQIRQIYKDHFDDEYGSDEELSPEMLERKEREIQINVDNRLAELRDRRIRCRVRFDGNHYRIDNVYGNPEGTINTIVKGNVREEFRPEKKLDANTPFETTWIETPAPTNGFEFYRYSHDRKTATVEKREISSTIVSNYKIDRILMMPNAFILQMKLGTRKNNLAAEPYDINEPKIEQLCSGTLEGLSVKIRPDPNEPDAKDRIEIGLYNDENIQTYTSLMICAKDDYSKVYYCQTPNPAMNKSPIFKKTCSNFDAQGFPHNVTQVIYDGKDNVQLQETYKIEDVNVNIPIPKEVFEFNPPESYEVTDTRLPEAQRQKARIENLKKRLKDEDSSGRRLEALVMLMEHLKDDPAELKEIAVSLLKDERDNIRAVALTILTGVLKDNPEELRKIATSMLNDDDPKIQKMVAKILRQMELKKKEE